MASFIRTPAGRLWWDRLKLRIPIIGPILYKMTLSRFARMFETLDRTGLPILRSLGLVAKTVGNVTRALERGDVVAQDVLDQTQELEGLVHRATVRP